MRVGSPLPGPPRIETVNPAPGSGGGAGFTDATSKTGESAAGCAPAAQQNSAASAAIRMPRVITYLTANRQNIYSASTTRLAPGPGGAGGAASRQWTRAATARAAR